MRTELNYIESAINGQEKLKVATERILISLKDLTSHLRKDTIQSIIDNFLFEVESVPSPIVKTPFIKGCNWDKLWNSENTRIFKSIIKQFDEAQNKKIDQALEPNNEYINEEPWLVNLKKQHNTKIDTSVLDSEHNTATAFPLLDLLGTIEIYTLRLHKIDRYLKCLNKLRISLFFPDKRTKFRQIIKFLFKNLDDSHSSINNSIARSKLNYLLNMNYNETRKYRLSF